MVKNKWIIESSVAAEDHSAALEKCTKLHALNAEQKLKCHSSQLREDQFTAGIATKSTDLRETDSPEDLEWAKTQAKNKIIVLT